MHTTVTSTLSPHTLGALLAGDILAIRIANFWAGSPRAPGTFAPYIGAPPDSRLTKSGPVQYEYRRKQDYFAAARVAPQATEHLDALRGALESACEAPVRTPVEPDHGAYHAGIAQRMCGEGMRLHMDYAPIDAPGWRIDEVASQLACVMHLQAARAGGVTRVYARSYKGCQDDAHRVAHSYHFDDAVLQNAPFVDVRADAGDLVLFNSRNFHRVSASDGIRLTFNAFFGRTRGGCFWMWS